jgi:acyl-CoA thioester hydrolase
MKEHSIDVRVRYSETDQMGVVYYSNYLVWFEIARTEFLRRSGFEYSKIEKERKIFLPVSESYCKYRFPVRYDDAITISACLTNMGTSRIAFGYEVKKGGEIAAVGYTVHAFVNDQGKPIPIPGDLKEGMSG